MRIVTFGASTNAKSIDKELAIFTVNHIQGNEIEILDLNDYLLPLYLL